MLKTIKEQVRKVVQYSQDIPDPQIDELMNNWLKAKSRFIDAFGGKLIWEYPIPCTFTLDESEKTSRIAEFIDYIDDKYDNTDLKSFIKSNQVTFYDNRVYSNSVHDGKKIPEGMKLLKAFKYFVPGERALNDIQVRASQIIQENKISGTLCFSVHPLDFLSSSENTYNWRSCHALDGEYRAGNLSYMQDNSTVICYLRGADNVKLPLFPDDVPWNNKKWRVLMHISEKSDIIFSGRQYPFTSSNGIELVRKSLIPILGRDIGAFCNWTDPVITEVPDSYGLQYDTVCNYMWFRGKIYDLRDLIRNAGNNIPLHYNDVLCSSCYRPHYTAYKNAPWFSSYEPHTILVGSDCLCLRCGKRYITDSETFMCDECELEYGTSTNDTYAYCERCGRRMLVEESLEVDGQDICADCIKNECFVCDYCDEIHLNESKHYIEEQDIYVCEECEISYFREQGE